MSKEYTCENEIIELINEEELSKREIFNKIFNNDFNNSLLNIIMKLRDENIELKNKNFKLINENILLKADMKYLMTTNSL
jgi:hypothetical protein